MNIGQFLYVLPYQALKFGLQTPLILFFLTTLVLMFPDTVMLLLFLLIHYSEFTF